MLSHLSLNACWVNLKPVPRIPKSIVSTHQYCTPHVVDDLGDGRGAERGGEGGEHAQLVEDALHHLLHRQPLGGGREVGRQLQKGDHRVEQERLPAAGVGRGRPGRRGFRRCGERGVGTWLRYVVFDVFSVEDDTEKGVNTIKSAKHSKVLVEELAQVLFLIDFSDLVGFVTHAHTALQINKPALVSLANACDTFLNVSPTHDIVLNNT